MTPQPGSDRCSGRNTAPAASSQLSGGVAAARREEPYRLPATSHATPPGAGTTRPLRGELARLRERLSRRDLAILDTLAALRLATTDQLARLHTATGSPATRGLRTRRSLARLHALGLAARTPRRMGGPRSGSTPHAHYLTPTGARVAGAGPVRPGRWRGAAQDHTLAVTELAVLLTDAHHATTLELVTFTAEPACWRTWRSPDGARRWLRPDAFCVIAAGAWDHLWFIELDRGTMSPSAVRRKAQVYADYAHTGTEQATHGVFPRTAYLTTTGTNARTDALARALADTPHAAQLVTVAPLHDAPTTLTAAEDP